jgi:hypothetical protein
MGAGLAITRHLSANIAMQDLMEWFAPHPKRPQKGHDVSVKLTSKR